MPRQAIPDSVDFYVDVVTELTAQVDDLRVADGTRAWVRGLGGAHGLWCLDQTSVLPIGPTVAATLSGLGRWIYFGSGFVPPPPPGAGSPYEFVFQPGGVASGNIYIAWAALVAAAAAFPGTKLVHFDDSFAPCVIPAGAWNLGPGSTTFTGSAGPLSGLTSTLVTIADGATLLGVYNFVWIDVDSQSVAGPIPYVIDAPAGGQTIYGFDFTARVRQTGVGGLFIRAAGPGTTALVGLRGAASFLNAGGRVIGATTPGAIIGIGTLEASSVGPDTVESVVGSTVIPLLVEPSSTLDAAQPGVLSGPFVPALVSIAAKVSYDDTLVPPLLGVAEVQAAIDALKGTIASTTYKFSGSMTGRAAVVLRARFLGDAPNSSFVAAVNFPATGPSASATLRVRPTANTMLTATNFRVFVNNVASGLVVVVPAGSTVIATSTIPLAIVAGDLVDLRVDSTAGGAGRSIRAGVTVVFF
jgi:hypothetical protein